jgi:long-chain acyl-CoA synthetase
MTANTPPSSLRERSADLIVETSEPALHVVTDEETTLDDLLMWAKRYPDDVGFRHHVPGSADWQDVSYGDFVRRMRAIASGLVATGVLPGDRVALMSRTRLEWALADYAIWQAGGVTVPIYETSSLEQVEWILSDSGAVVAIVEADRHADLVERARGRATELRECWVIDDAGLDRLGEWGAEVSDDVLDERRAGLGAASLATIVYTSGTTGPPKGCPLTHRNLLAVYRNTAEAPGIPDIFNAGQSTLLFLPLAHCLARIIHLSCVHCRVCIGYTAEVKDLPADMASFRPTLVLSVPRVFEKIYNTARRKAIAKRTGLLFDRAEHVAVAYSKALDTGGAGPLLRLEHELYDRLVYRRIRAAMGGQVRWSVSGGAPLGARLGHFFRGMGVNVLEGWGLSETSTGGTLNLPARQRVGSVGPPVPGSRLRIAPDGEILVKGDFVFSGYWQNEAATKEAIDEDGWFHTGDIGQLDADGFATITGRKKELIVTAGGKNVAPAVLEDRLRAHWLVSQCVVVGDRRPFIGCLVTLDADVLDEWAGTHGRSERTAAALHEDPEIRAIIQEAVSEANSAVSQAEAIRQFRVLDRDFTEAGGQLTPTLKVKRDIVATQFAAEVELLYGEPRAKDA